MFTITSACCCGVNDQRDKLIARAKKTIIADAALTLIFGILAFLGLSGILPLAVGITFCVIAIVQGIPASIMAKGILQKNPYPMDNRVDNFW